MKDSDEPTPGGNQVSGEAGNRDRDSSKTRRQAKRNCPFVMLIEVEHSGGRFAHAPAVQHGRALKKRFVVLASYDDFGMLATYHSSMDDAWPQIEKFMAAGARLTPNRMKFFVSVSDATKRGLPKGGRSCLH